MALGRERRHRIVRLLLVGAPPHSDREPTDNLPVALPNRVIGPERTTSTLRSLLCCPHTPRNELAVAWARTRAKCRANLPPIGCRHKAEMSASKNPTQGKFDSRARGRCFEDFSAAPEELDSVERRAGDRRPDEEPRRELARPYPLESLLRLDGWFGRMRRVDSRPARGDSIVRRFWRASAVLWTGMGSIRVGLLPFALTPLLVSSWSRMAKPTMAMARTAKTAANKPRLRGRPLANGLSSSA